MAFCALFSYLAGSIPFGLLVGLSVGRDVRLAGSRNIGASNVWRLCGWKCGLAVFGLDFLKGLAAATWLVALLRDSAFPAHPWPGILAGLSAVLGHNYPVWLAFRGGKGVATSAGAVAGLMPFPFAVALASFVATVAVWRCTSLGSMLASMVLFLSALLILPDPLGGDLPLVSLSALLSLLIVLRHRQNISRILAGSENRFPPPGDREAGVDSSGFAPPLPGHGESGVRTKTENDPEKSGG